MTKISPTNGSGSYVAIPDKDLSSQSISLRAVEPEDIEPIRQWRNAQVSILRQDSVITQADQTQYFALNVWPEKQRREPSQILLAIEIRGELAGYGGLVNISWREKSAEVSFLLKPSVEEDTDRRRAIFLGFLSLLQDLAFDDLGLHRLFTETYAFRASHIASLEEAGFRLEGCLRQHVVVNNSRVDSLIHGCLASDRGK